MNVEILLTRNQQHNYNPFNRYNRDADRCDIISSQSCKFG